MKRESGFTLVELIAVLVILGVLGGAALPRFVNLQNEAAQASVEAMAGALQNATSAIHAKAVLGNLTNGTQIVNISGTNITVVNGYPVGQWSNSVRRMVNLDDLSITTQAYVCDSRWCGVGGWQRGIPGAPSNTTGRGAMIWPSGYRSADRCLAYYINQEDGTEPLIGATTDGC